MGSVSLSIKLARIFRDFLAVGCHPAPRPSRERAEARAAPPGMGGTAPKSGSSNATTLFPAIFSPSRAPFLLDWGIQHYRFGRLERERLRLLLLHTQARNSRLSRTPSSALSTRKAARLRVRESSTSSVAWTGRPDIPRALRNTFPDRWNGREGDLTVALVTESEVSIGCPRS